MEKRIWDGVVTERDKEVYALGQARHAVNLWDIHAKYADVISLDEALAYLDELPATRAAQP